MRKVLLVLSASAFALLGTTSLASAQAYGDAGCGLGSMIFGNQGGAVQILAATTNGTSGNQTFGITSGTSNCGGLSGGAVATATFIEQNRASVASDAARGVGPSIESLTHLAGCADPEAVGMTLQAHYGFIFPDVSVSDTAVSTTIVDILSNEASLQCQLLG